jgi:hypothetical protein
VHVDEARSDGQPGSIDDLLGFFWYMSDSGYPFSPNLDIRFEPGVACAVDDEPVLDNYVQDRSPALREENTAVQDFKVSALVQSNGSP